MANNNTPYGLLPVGGSIGSAANFEMANGWIASTNTTAIYKGDPIQRLATGYMSAWTAGTAVSQLAGIFWSCEYLSTSLGKKVFNQYWPGTDVASSAQSSIFMNYIPINPGSFATFRAQSDATGITFGNIGLNIDVNMGTGTTIPVQSGCYLDTTTMSTLNTKPFRIVNLYGGGLGQGGFGGIQPSTTAPYGGSATGAFNWVLVVANVNNATGI